MKEKHALFSAEQTYAIILRELAENIHRYRKREAFILDGNKELCNENEKLQDERAFLRRKCETLEGQNDNLRRLMEETKARVDDLAKELAVTECQLEEARKRLKRYEGGGE